ncbi:MAG: HAD hydrolase-like protein [Caldilineaceae bacterium]|nr:HAD hydrolase-like protein [Caldilineaceae bacterium]
MSAHQAVYVGDRIDDDCEGATAAGLTAFLIDRDAAHAQTASERADFTYLSNMAELLHHLPKVPAHGGGS